MRLLKLLRSCSGFTLPEITSALLISVAVAAVSGAGIVFGLRIMLESADMFRAKLIGDGVYNFISGRLVRMNGAEISITAPDTEAIYIAESGEIFLCEQSGERTPLFDESLFRETSVAVTLCSDLSNTDVADISVEVSNDNGRLYLRESAVKLISGEFSLERNALNSTNNGIYIFEAVGG